MKGSINTSKRRSTLPSSFERQDNADFQQHERRDEIPMTYSEDVSPTQIYTKDSLPLIELDSSDEEDILLFDVLSDSNSDGNSDDGNENESRSASTQTLMLPRLKQNFEQQEQPAERKYSDGDILDVAFDDAVRETKRKAASPKRPPTQKDPSSAKTMAEKFNFPAATLSPINMRRASSTPAKISSRKTKKKSPIKPPTTPHNDAHTKRSRAASVFVSPLAKAYSLRKQISLPNSKDRSPLLLSPDGYDGSISSASSLGDDDDDEMAQLAQELATPKSRGNIFRSVRIGTPTSFRRGSGSSALAPHPPMTSQGKSSEQERLQRVDTGKTDGSDDEMGGLELASTEDADNRETTTARRRSNYVISPLQIDQQDESHHGHVEAFDDSSSAREFEPFLRRRSVQYIVYLSTFACFGTIIRVFCGRIFGLDCEFKQVNDWLSPLSRNICVTSSGTTEQIGGALFVDLPANMLGSFIMGLLTVLKPDVWPPIPWLRRGHPLQQHDALHVAIKTGMCGSLTTFASWNAQMVVMMDGSHTALGHQVVTALFGYVIGIMAALASFLFGTHCSTWLNNWRNLDDDFSTKHDIEDPPPRIIHFPQLGVGQTGCYQAGKSVFIGRRLPFVILGVLMTLFLLGDFFFDSTFYRILWLEVLFTPPGALLRWILGARFNNVTLREGWDWLPLGTLAANLLASLISILLLAMEFRSSSINSGWAMPVITAARVGMAGSLSTVSTFVKELVDMTNRYPHQAKSYYYGFISIGAAMMLSLIVYIPIVRSS